MTEILNILLGVLVAASLAAIVGYVLMFFAIAAWTVLRSLRRDPLADEFDELLAEMWAVDSTALLGGACPPKALMGVPSPTQHAHGRTRRFS
ncbi:MAG: hypothetical protein ACYCV7_11110 [Acidimicrobiales bacterium]